MNPPPPTPHPHPHPHYIFEDSNFDFRYVMLCDLDIPIEKIVDLFGDPDQRGVWSGSALFANYPFKSLQTTMGLNIMNSTKHICKLNSVEQVSAVSAHTPAGSYQLQIPRSTVATDVRQRTPPRLASQRTQINHYDPRNETKHASSRSFLLQRTTTPIIIQQE